MILTMKARSIITVPRELREQLGIETGDPLDVTVEDGRLIFTPVSVVPRTLALTEKGLRKEAEADAAIKAGRVKSFDSVEALLKDLNED